MGPMTHGPARRRVLLADDQSVNRLVASAMLESLGPEVEAVADGTSAIAAWAGGAFDVVLMDLLMPNMGGLEAAAAIRRREAGSADRTRLVAVTASTAVEDRKMSLAAGFDVYLAKPMRRDELRAAVEEPDPAHRVLRRCGGDDGFARELASCFLESAPICLAALATALRADDAAAAAAAAHGLKGSAATIGAVELAEACRAVEEAALRGWPDEAIRGLRAVKSISGRLLAPLSYFRGAGA